jgi:hypothetical protein
MEPISLVLGLFIGGGLTGVCMVLWSQKSSSRIASELEQSRTELQKLRGSAAQLKSVQQSEAEAKRQLATFKEKAATLEKNFAQHASEVSQLKQALTAAEQARDQAIDEANARQNARQQAEGRLKQAERLASESARKAEEMVAELEKSKEEQESLQEMVRRRGDEIQRLRADMDERGQAGADLESSVEVFAGAEGSLREILDILVQREAQQAAVLADSNGIVVASAGDTDLRDGIAAAAQLFAATSNSFDGMVPFGALQSFAVRDRESVVLSGRAFDAAGEAVALCTYGSRLPSERALDGAMASLSAALD